MKQRYDDIDEYIADLKMEIAANEQCATHHYNLGLALLSKRDFVGAEEALLNAVRNSPHLAEAYVQLGGICLERGDLEGCLRYNEEAAQCRAKFPVPWSNIAFVHLQRGEPDKAITALKKALKWDPDFVQAKNALTTAYYMQGDFEACEKLCKEILEKEPAFAPAWNNMALAQFDLGKYAEARQSAAKAAELGFGELPLETVSGNGALVRDARGELLRCVRIDPVTLEELITGFPTCCLVCVTSGKTYVRGSRDQQLAGYLPSRGLAGRIAARRFRRAAPDPDTLYDQTDASVLSQPVCKVNCRVFDQGVKRELEAFVAEHSGTLVNASFDGDLFELTDASVNKGEAVAWLANWLGLCEDEVAVYGDGGNDLAMLERFEHAYATRNGSDAAKAAAGNVIGSCSLHAVPRHIVATVRREGPLTPLSH